MKEPHFELSDNLFELQFSTCKLNPALFSHEAHLRLAWIHVYKYGTEKAIKNICEQLPVFVQSAGAAGKYNVTLTVAAIKAVSHFYHKSAADNFQGFINEFPGLRYNFRGLMAHHYSTDIFNSELAKKQYLEPELIPFD